MCAGLWCLRAPQQYYGRYDETEYNPRPFAKFLQEYGIETQYTMPGTPEPNEIVEGESVRL
jgi:hypothetical protein